MSIHKMLSAHNDMLAAISPSGGNAWWPEDGIYECRLMALNEQECKFTEWDDNKRPTEYPAISLQLAYQLMQDVEYPHEPRTFSGELVIIPRDPEVFGRNVNRIQYKIANLKSACNTVLAGRTTPDFGANLEMLQAECKDRLVVVQVRISSKNHNGKVYKNDRILSRVEVS